MNLLIIPDAHANPDYDNERFTHLGKFIVAHKPEYIEPKALKANAIRKISIVVLKPKRNLWNR